MAEVLAGTGEDFFEIVRGVARRRWGDGERGGRGGQSSEFQSFRGAKSCDGEGTAGRTR